MGLVRRWRWKRLSCKGSLDQILAAIKDKNYITRADAAASLAFSTDTRSLDALIELLRDETLDVRIEAVKALARQPNPACVSPLINSIRNESLQPFMAKKTVVPTKISIDQATGTAAYMKLVQTVVVSLEHLGQYAVDPLLTAIDDPSPRIRGVAIFVLGSIKSIRSVPAIEVVFRNNHEDFIMRMVAGYALEQITGKKYLIPFLNGLGKLEAAMVLVFMKSGVMGKLCEIERHEQGLTTDSLREGIKRLT